MSAGVERFPDNAQYFPGDSSQQSQDRHYNAFGIALSEAGRLAAAMKRLSNEKMPAEQARSCFHTRTYRKIIHYLQAAEGRHYTQTAPLCGKEVLHDSKCVYACVCTFTHMQLLTVAETVTECQVRL